ncbi:MAG TPA: GDP-mannose 4,6-dehydratase [Candidatus Nanoarchaeia archaeon]|nr:GDP-mannose 4,6-dehydratase [Candidatus Nanoarchaeia archaeon]
MTKSKVALITGVGGQDGSYLSEFLLSKNYLVRGIVRRASFPNTKRIDHLLHKHSNDSDPNCPFILKYADLTDAHSVRDIIEQYRPDEIYNLAAQSHVGISFANAESTININALGPLRILETLRQMKLNCRFYQASSSEMFGVSPPPQNEQTPFRPQSPYGISKVAAFHMTRLYREAYGLFASNGILFNHESPRRGLNFVTRKITRGISEIAAGLRTQLILGNLEAKRDWGFSGEYVQAMWMILQHDKPDDFVIATQETHTVREFLQLAFSLLGLNYLDFVATSDRHQRPAEVPALLGDATKARTLLGWSPSVKFRELTTMMLDADLKEVLQEQGVIPIERDIVYPEGYFIEKGREIIKKKFPDKYNEAHTVERTSV